MTSTKLDSTGRLPCALRRISGAALILAWLGVGILPGCAPYRGARLYISGSEALERGDTARAIRDLEAAAELAPEGSEIYNHLGLAYADVGREADAQRAFERALELDCTNTAARANREAARGAGHRAPADAEATPSSEPDGGPAVRTNE